MVRRDAPAMSRQDNRESGNSKPIANPTIKALNE
jgi:hypothetical protein